VVFLYSESLEIAEDIALYLLNAPSIQKFPNLKDEKKIALAIFESKVYCKGINITH
jgi:hypothetical protein